jgi:hypothetical protein
VEVLGHKILLEVALLNMEVAVAALALLTL